jgi:hypothetical protein
LVRRRPLADPPSTKPALFVATAIKRTQADGPRMTQYQFAWLRLLNADRASAETTSPFRSRHPDRLGSFAAGP